MKRITLFLSLTALLAILYSCRKSNENLPKTPIKSCMNCPQQGPNIGNPPYDSSQNCANLPLDKYYADTLVGAYFCKKSWKIDATHTYFALGTDTVPYTDANGNPYIATISQANLQEAMDSLSSNPNSFRYFIMRITILIKATYCPDYKWKFEIVHPQITLPPYNGDLRMEGKVYFVPDGKFDRVVHGENPWMQH